VLAQNNVADNILFSQHTEAKKKPRTPQSQNETAGLSESNQQPKKPETTI
jgi:hypothetical protein